MPQAAIMSATFETQKNTRALFITLGVHGLLFVLFVYFTFTIPVPPPPLPQEGFEVNLGNSDMGLGDEQPLVPGEPAPAAEQVSAPPPTTTQASNDPAVETNDADADEPVVVKKPEVKPTRNTTPNPSERTTTRRPAPTVAEPTPAPPRPKALYGGSTGTGGNNADSYNNSRNQGIAGGTGDQGRPNGNPNSDNYTGSGGSGSGVSISRGLTGRKIVRLPSFEDDFNENAKIAVDIRVDEAGNVIAASYQPLGSTTSNPRLRTIALNKARQLKFNTGDMEAAGTIIFNFRLKE